MLFRQLMTLSNAQTRMAQPSAPATLADLWSGTRVVPTILLAPHRGHMSTAPLPADPKDGTTCSTLITTPG